jgi:spore maturation protein B
METLNIAFQSLIPLFILFTVVYGYLKGVPVYESFVSGAKDGLGIIISIFPYVLAIFLAVKTFQASGFLETLQQLFAVAAGPLHIPPEIFSVALLKPFSNAATLGVFVEILKTAGPDSLAGLMSAVIMGSAETTFYVLAVYLGAVGLKKTQYLVPVCLTADLLGVIIAITVVRLLFY